MKATAITTIIFLIGIIFFLFAAVYAIDIFARVLRSFSITISTPISIILLVILFLLVFVGGFSLFVTFVRKHFSDPFGS